MARFPWIPAIIAVAGGFAGIALLHMGVLPGAGPEYFPRGHDPFGLSFSRGVCYALGAYGASAAYWTFAAPNEAAKPSLMAIGAWVGAVPLLSFEAALGPGFSPAVRVALFALAAVASGAAGWLTSKQTSERPARFGARAWGLLGVFPVATIAYVAFMRLLLPH